jgi:hypothetical protein
MLGGKLAVLQSPIFDGLSLEPFALFDDGRNPTELGAGRPEVVFKKDAVPEALAPAFDLADHDDVDPAGGDIGHSRASFKVQPTLGPRRFCHRPSTGRRQGRESTNPSLG